MRLHYDKIIPQILRELTGEEGKEVRFGEHKMAFERVPADMERQAGEAVNQPRSNLIFRKPTGEPETSIIARSYDLSKTKNELSKRGGFPMFGSEQFVRRHVEQMLHEGYEPDEIIKAADNVKQLQPMKGETALQALARNQGVDPKLFDNLPPNQSIPRALEFLTSLFHYNY